MQRWQTRMWRYRIALFTGSVFIGAIGAWYAIASSILMGSFAQVEQQRTEEDVQRTIDTATYELASMMGKVRDYAVWDDTYAFVEGKNPHYIGSSVTPGTFGDNKIQLMAVLKAPGKLIYGQMYEAKKESFYDIPADVKHQLTTARPFLQSIQTGVPDQGLLVLPEGLMLLTYHPILKTDETGPVQGVLIFGRYLSTQLIAELNQLTNLTIEVQPLNSKQLPSDLRAIVPQLMRQKVVVRPLTSQTIAGYTCLQDIYGQSSILLKITAPRTIYQQGILSSRYLALSLVVMGAISSVVIGMLLKRLVQNLRERDRLERSLHAEEQYRQKAQELEQALHKLQQAQAQLVQTEKMSSLGQLVAGIAHEINNPVSFIYGNLKPLAIAIQDLFQLVHLYKKQYPTPSIDIRVKEKSIELPFLEEDLPKLISSMKNGSERIQQIVLSLRNFSRLDESGMKFVDIHEGIDNTLLILQSRLKPQVGFPGIEVIKDYGDLPPVECYAGQLNQVFLNILNNAIDALQEKAQSHAFTPTLRIQTQALPPLQITIRVADNGMGIPKESQQKLFDPFFTTKPVGQGTGLGLAISYKIVVEKHQGLLLYHSTPDQGAEFTIQIPVEQTG